MPHPRAEWNAVLFIKKSLRSPDCEGEPHDSTLCDWSLTVVPWNNYPQIGWWV